MKIALIATWLLALIQGLESITISICLGGQKCLHLCWVEAFLDKLTISSMEIKHIPKVFEGFVFEIESFHQKMGTVCSLSDGLGQQQYSGKLWCLNYARLVLKECYSSSLKLIKGMVDSSLHAECILPSSQCYSKI